MARKEKQYLVKCRRKLVELVWAKGMYSVLSCQFDSSDWMLRKCVIKQVARCSKRDDGGLTTNAQEELSHLRRANRQLNVQVTREFLSKDATCRLTA